MRDKSAIDETLWSELFYNRSKWMPNPNYYFYYNFVHNKKTLKYTVMHSKNCFSRYK